MAIYICTIKVHITPKIKKSRLIPIIKTLEQYPVVMDENMNIEHSYIMRTIKNSLKNRVTDWSRYNVKYSVSNIKYSTKCYWTILKK